MKKLIFIILFLPLFATAADPFTREYAKELREKTGNLFRPKERQGNYFATYYVATGGNDATGDGSMGNPWATLYKATNTVTSAGNLIYMQTGTYNENTQCVLAPGVSIEGADSATTIIKSTLTADGTEIINMRSVSEGTNGNQSISYLQFDGQNANDMSSGTAWGIYINCRSNVDIYYCSFKNFRLCAVKNVGGFDNDTDNEPGTYAVGNDFHHNRVLNCSGYVTVGFPYGSGGYWLSGQDSSMIHYNYMDQTQRPVGQNGWLLKAQNWTKNCHVHNNTFKKKPLGTVNGDAGGNIDWTWGNEWGDNFNLEFDHNTCIGSGVDFNRNYNLYVHHNSIYNESPNSFVQTAITLEFYTFNSRIEDNYIENVGKGIYMTLRTGDSLVNFSIQRNVILITAPSGGVESGQGKGIDFGGEAAQYFYDMKVWNNTIVCKTGYEALYGISSPMATSGTVRKLSIRNNIIMNFTAELFSENGGNTVSFDSTNFDHNLIRNNGSGNVPVWRTSPAGGTNYVYTDNITSNPLFVSDYSDVHLQSGSPCIAAGINVGNGVDIGAYQYSTDTDPPATSAFNPANGATGVTPGTVTVIITWDEAMDGSTLNSSNITGITGSFTVGSNYVSITTTIAAFTTKNITIGTGCKDVAGNNMASPVSYSFTTGAAPVTPVVNWPPKVLVKYN